MGGLFLVALVVGTTKATQHASARLVAAPCSASQLSAAYRGPLHVDSVENFGCVGNWAFLWATIGSGVQEVSVTEVLQYDARTSAWHNAPRLRYCGHGVLPHYVDRWGCHSN